MIFSLEVRRARQGDCLLLHYGTANDRGLLLIDGGPSQVYQRHLRARLSQLRTARGLADAAPLPVDLMMVSHIDDDHIGGLLELTAELVGAAQARQPALVKVRQLWHNTFDDLIGNTPDELRRRVTAAFGAASLAGDPDVAGLDRTAAQVLASVAQGMRLRDDARALHMPVNTGFGGNLVMAGDGLGRVAIGRGLTVTVVSPSRNALLALQRDHDAFLRTQPHDRASQRSLASFTDDAIPNLSSIVVIAEAGGRRMLLTGDGRGDRILEGLEGAGVLRQGALHVDVLKMPHHGSDRNMTVEFLQRITADHYVFSGNGEFGNPERATLEMLDAARGTDDYVIHLTYPVAEIDEARQRDWITQQARERARRQRGQSATVRPDWADDINALATLFATRPALARRVRVVDATSAHVIDLLDPVGV